MRILKLIIPLLTIACISSCTMNDVDKSEQLTDTTEVQSRGGQFFNIEKFRQIFYGDKTGDSYTGIRTVMIGNHQMLEFPSHETYILKCGEIEEELDKRDDEFLKLHIDMTNVELDQYELQVGHDYFSPLRDIVAEIGLENPYYDIFSEQEDEYYNCGGPDPELETLLSEEEMHLVNDKQRDIDNGLEVRNNPNVTTCGGGGPICTGWKKRIVNELFVDSDGNQRRMRLVINFRNQLLVGTSRSKIKSRRLKGNGKWAKSRYDLGVANQIIGTINCEELACVGFDGFKRKRARRLTISNTCNDFIDNWQTPQGETGALFEFEQFSQATSPYGLPLIW